MNRCRPRAERAAHHQRESRAALLRLDGWVGQLPAIPRPEHCDSRTRDDLTRCACTLSCAHVENPFSPVVARKEEAHGDLSRNH